MNHKPIDILLTGASGFLGHYILAELLVHPHVRCRVLLRNPVAENLARLERLLIDVGVNLPAMMANKRVTVVQGELPNSLGSLDVDGVDLIIHSAGNTAFNATGSGEPSRTNVDGTRAMLSLATNAGIRRFVYVSTAYVCGEQVGHLPEAFYPTMPPVRNNYERSKWEAEALVWNWSTSTRTATICRPSILFGDSQTGRATTAKGLHLVAKATEILARAANDGSEAHRHHIPLRILGRSDATCNVVPVDWAARQIATITLTSTTEPSVHHITNPDPPTHQEVKEWLEKYFDIAGGQFSDASWPLRDSNHYEDLFYSLGNICLDYFRNGLTFESQCSANIPAGKRLIDQEAFFQSISYAQATNWFRSPYKMNKADDLEQRSDAFSSKWYFESFLPRVVPRSAITRVSELTTIVRYTITGPEGGSWICRFDSGQLKETQAAPSALKPEFEFRLSHEDLVEIAAGRKPMQDIFLSGCAEILGNVEQAMKMVPIIGALLKEFPVTDVENSAVKC
ncbi:MAG: NAD-dependent epimerase/dehydratase family protein [Planctomycetes bacterium]|nr:NAD-dependent epimerase/dehydratase family protein [Planctomycetota bacterium]